MHGSSILTLACTSDTFDISICQQPMPMCYFSITVARLLTADAYAVAFRPRYDMIIIRSLLWHKHFCNYHRDCRQYFINATTFSINLHNTAFAHRGVVHNNLHSCVSLLCILRRHILLAFALHSICCTGALRANTVSMAVEWFVSVCV